MHCRHGLPDLLFCRTSEDTCRSVALYARAGRDRPMLRIVANRVLPHEHSQPVPHDLFCTRKIPVVGSSRPMKLTPAFKSGQSLIEHSYKADSDLSPAGWEYAERLKEFVTERRAKSLEQRGYNPDERRLVVRPPFLSFGMALNAIPRFGPRRVVALTTPLGHSKRQNHRFPPCRTPSRLEPSLRHRPHPSSRSK